MMSHDIIIIILIRVNTFIYIANNKIKAKITLTSF